MRIEKRTMNWLPKPSLYQEQVAKRTRQRNVNRTFLANQANLSSTIGGIVNNQMTGTTDIVSNIALKRMGYDKKA